MDEHEDCETVLGNIPLKQLNVVDYKYINQLQNAQGVGDTFYISSRLSGIDTSDNLNCNEDYYLILHFRGQRYPFCLNTKAHEALNKIKLERFNNFKAFIYLLMLPIFGLLILGRALIWIIHGFKSRS